MAATPSDEHLAQVAGHEIAITNPGKVFFPERGETKLRLVEYYLSVSGPLLAAMGGRPVLLQRFPHFTRRDAVRAQHDVQKRIVRDGVGD